MLPRLRIAAAILAVALAVPAVAAPAEPEPLPADREEIEDIVVTGQRPETVRELMRNFIFEIGDPVSNNQGFARWRDRLCVGIFNLPHQPSAQYLADKITLIAQEVGLKTGSPGCSPNLKIVFSPDARALASSLVEASPGMFRPFGGTGGTTQGLAALEQFKTSDAPVRWWQITMVVDDLGIPAILLPQVTDGSQEGDMSAVPVVRGIASRLKRPVNDAIWGSLVIVDANKLGNAKWPQLAGYLTMVSLAQVNPEGLPNGYESILNLFNATNPPPDLTDLDIAYLRGLYHMDTMVMPHIQRGSLAHWMMREQTRLRE